MQVVLTMFQIKLILLLGVIHFGYICMNESNDGVFASVLGGMVDVFEDFNNFIPLSLYSSDSEIKVEDKCPSGWFLCANRNCVLNRWKCDGENDCGDNSDEEPFCSVAAQCTPKEYRCHDGTKCIDLNWFCDGHIDCADLSDEVPGCQKQDVCDGFRCKINSKCLPMRFHCDGVIDCPDKSDELNCSANDNFYCREDDLKFYCDDRSLCLPKHLVCDGNKNCKDGSDEGGQCINKTCEKTGCSHDCFQTPRKAHCYCPLGYELGIDGLKCKDIDECLNQTCSQFCHNTVGSFTCTCQEGYILQLTNGVGRFCAAEDPEPILLYASSKELKLLKLHSLQMYSLKSGINHATGIDYDSHTNRIYWSEIAKGVESVKTCTLDGKDESVIINVGISVVEDVVIDWIGHNVYFTDSVLMRLGVCSNNGFYCKVLLKSLQRPRALVLDPANGTMYWSDWSYTPKIEKAGMDGSSRVELVSNDLGWPNGLAIDHALKRLYWIDAKLSRVEYITLDDQNERRLVLEKMMPHPFAFTIFEDTLYWTDWSSKTLESCNKFTGREREVLSKEEQNIPMGVHVYHPVLQVAKRNPCMGNRCSHLCLIAPNNSYKCECGVGYSLSADGLSCTRDKSRRILLAIETGIYEFIEVELGRHAFKLLMREKEHLTVGPIAYDPTNNSIIYNDMEKKRLVAYDLITEQNTVLISSKIESVDCIGIDWLNGNMYWTDALRKILEVSRLNGENRKVLISENLDHPMEMVLVPQKGIMFMSLSSGHRPRIERMGMDGSNRHILLDFDNTAPISLAVDVESELLYWTNMNTGQIEWSNFDGKQRSSLDLYSGRPGVISTASNIVMWTDTADGLHLWMYQELESLIKKFQLNLNANSNLTSKSRLLVMQSDYEQVGEGVCKNGGCSHLCLPNKGTFTCACPSGLELGEDGQTCQIATECSQYEFKCSDKKCIHVAYICDNINDCPNGEDEQNCKPKCTTEQFRCSDGQCIPSGWVCDGTPQCSGGADEYDCSYASCPENWFQCVDDGKCIVNHWLCDDNDDCQDGSDEKNCTQKPTCKIDEFKCNSGYCLPLIWRCDGEIDCRDSSDEGLTCETSIKKCDAMEFTCANGHCIVTDLVCDHDDDCGDGSDETNEKCEHLQPCPTGMYKCSQTNRCIQFKSLCDGVNDCLDNEDEHGCTNEANCNEEKEFRCVDNGHCIPKVWICDGDGDCGDASDEKLEECHSEFIPQTGTPIPLFSDLKARTVHLHHEGKTNSSNETGLLECDLMEYQCHSGDCIPLNELCNHLKNCKDGTDEGSFCGLTCEVENGGCSDLCVPTDYGTNCRCREGYALGNDDKTCYDIDECNYFGACSQNCKNTPGSFTCSCADGYEFKPDRQSCKARGDAGQLLITYSSKIVSSSLGSNHGSLITHGGYRNIKATDFDMKTSTVYWVDATEGTLNRYNTKTKYQEILIKELQSPIILVVDWISRQLVYWESRGNGHISVCDLDGKYCVNGFNIGSKVIASMAIDARYGLLFWTTWSKSEYSADGTIERAYLNGKQKYVLANDKLVWPVGLTIDYLHHELYWADAHLEVLEVMKIQGTDRRIVTRQVNRPMALTVFEDHLYWAEWKSNSIRSCNKFDCDEIDILLNNTVKVYDLAVFHNVQQMRGSASCMTGDVFSGLNKKCSHICMSAANSFACYCPSGMKLDNETNRNCVELPSSKPKTCQLKKFCYNGGSCYVDSSGAEFCQCLDGYKGIQCEKKSVKSYEAITVGKHSNHGLETGLIVGFIFIIAAATAAYLYYRRFGCSTDKFRDQFAAIRLENPEFGANCEGTNIDEICYGTETYKSYSNPMYNDIDLTDTVKYEISFPAVGSSHVLNSGESSSMLEHTGKTKEF